MPLTCLAGRRRAPGQRWGRHAGLRRVALAVAAGG